MTNEELQSAQSKFIRQAEEYWDEIQKGDTKGANAKTRANDKIVSTWSKKSAVEDLLLPLFSHDSPAVQFAAAAYLIECPARQQAIDLLSELAKRPTGLIAHSAKAILRIHKVPLK